MRTFIISLGVILLATTSGFGKTIHVPGDSSTIQAGIDGAVDGDTVLVADGVYTGEGNRDIDFLGKGIVVRSENGPDSTIIDCEDEREVRGFHFHNGEGPDSRLEGFTVQHGYHYDGSGIRIENSSPTIADCHILDNWAAWFGAGIYITTKSSPTITNCIISNNYNWWESGGGIYSVYRSFPTIHNCIISNNQAGESWMPDWGDGGGIYCDSAAISNCEIYRNKAAYLGGGIYCRSTTITNCLIYGNSAFWEGVGGGIYCKSSIITNCIIKGNAASSGLGGGVFAWGSTTIKNSIVRNVISGGAAVTYSNIEGGWPGEGNIDEVPLFRDPDNHDYHLMAIYCGDPHDSPCIDAGDPSILDDSLDCWHGLGTARSDMGAYGGHNSGWPTAVEEDEEIETPAIPESFVLYQNYPNPFNASTEIRYQVSKDTHVSLTLFNTLGQHVRTLVDAEQWAGEYWIVWDGRDASGQDVASGLYFCRLKAGGLIKTIKMVLMK